MSTFLDSTLKILSLYINFVTDQTVTSAELRHRAKFRRNFANRGWNSIFRLSIWRPSAILNLWCVCSDHPQRAFGAFHHCAKIGCNRCSRFDNMNVFRFRYFGLKTPIHALSDAHTHARTYAKGLYYLSPAICYSYGADNKWNEMN